MSEMFKCNRFATKEEEKEEIVKTKEEVGKGKSGSNQV